MGFRVDAVSVEGGSTPTRIVSAQAGDLEVWISPIQNERIYIGDSSAGTGGFPVSGNSFHTQVRPGDELWAASSDTSYGTGVRVLTRSA